MAGWPEAKISHDLVEFFFDDREEPTILLSR